MLIYHGTLDKYLSSFESDGILLRKSKTHLDFGRGFYTTDDKWSAITTRANANNNYPQNSFAKPAIVILEYSVNGCSVKTFQRADKNWASFVLKQRTEPTPHEYDIVHGPIADGAAFMLTEDYINGIITESEFRDGIIPSGALSKSKQISFHTSNALSCVRICGYAIMGSEE